LLPIVSAACLAHEVNARNISAVLMPTGTTGDSKMTLRHATACALLAALTGLAAAPGEAAVAVDIRVAPPPPPVVVAPAPRPGHVWVDGYWRWNGHRHVWVKGYWARARPGYRYVPAHWVQRGPYWHFVPGRWVR
jgi:hypothetical protein